MFGLIQSGLHKMKRLRRASKRGDSKSKWTYKPILQELEDRLCPNTYFWVGGAGPRGGAGSDWAIKGNWKLSTGVGAGVPAPAAPGVSPCRGPR